MIAKRGLRAEGRRQPESHRPETSGRQPLARLVEPEMLGGPHLMLAHVRRDNRVPVPCELIQPVNDVLRLDLRVRRLHIGQWMLGLPFVDLIPPRLALFDGVAVRRRAQHGVELAQDGLHIADDRNVHLDVLAD